MVETSLQKHLLREVPKTAYYISNFISQEEEKELLNNINGVPKPKWTQLSNRRLQNWGGFPHPKGMVPEKIPAWLLKYMNRIFQLGVFQDKMPNHVLINEYEPGQGIMPHEDGALFYPTITTINIGSHTVLDFYTHINDSEFADVDKLSLIQRHAFSLLLEPRSLLILQDFLYCDYLHGIQEITQDAITEKITNLEHCPSQLGETLERKTRVSLTIRHVPKLIKFTLKLGK